VLLESRAVIICIVAVEQTVAKQSVPILDALGLVVYTLAWAFLDNLIHKGIRILVVHLGSPTTKWGPWGTCTGVL
jgi:hypothetical protein